jgi:hypothetical protein
VPKKPGQNLKKMKKTIFATVLLVAFCITSFAAKKDADTRLLKDLSTTLKSSTQVNWSTTETYSRATFRFNDKTAFAFYRADDNELIGFAIQADKSDLPSSVSTAVSSKYGDWNLVDAIAFIDADGYINYYAQVQKNKKGLALKITPNGNLSTYAKYIPANE